MNMNDVAEKPSTMVSRKLGKLMLTMHIAVSVGWLGAVAGFLVLSIAALGSRNVSIVRGAYLSMNLVGLYLLVPLSFAALLTGVVQSLGTSWGLFRQYWTIAKLALTIGSVGLLLLHQFMAVERAAQRVIASPTGTMPAVNQIGAELALKAGLAIIVLLIVTTLSVYKPWGLTAYGHRLQRKRQTTQFSAAVEIPTAPSGSHLAQTARRRARLALILGLLSAVIIALVSMHHLHGLSGHGI